ncbi:MAG: selenocysteine-specific translation elongation factor [Chloroflexi bacterium]|nr:selenocysteine-specific translation elongation factor [Chloroflexota bacterium]
MYVLGTAGHVDHGKSTLIHALTGIDPDRLIEEKERGLTIDLGFAWLELPSGKEVSIVDVPGHERFVKNMLAGVGGIDLALLVIAADEGVMPQTREHLAILDILNITQGILVITKKDLADEEMLELVMMDIEEVVAGTALENAPTIVTSATTGDGLPELLSAIDNILESTSPRRDIGKPRLCIDRVFTMKGFGTVVTGTLIDGKLSVGQQIDILPTGLRANIRGLQVHKKKLGTALPGTRVAINLSGVGVEELQRGLVVTTPGWLEPTRFIDVQLRTVTDLSQPIAHNKAITFHTGTSEISGRIRLLDTQKLNQKESGWAQLTLSQPVAVARGDLFIIRSSTGTLGGGRIVDTKAKRHRRFQQSIIESLEVRDKGTPDEILLATLESNEPTEFGALLSLCSISNEEATKALQTLISENRAVAFGSEGSRRFLFSTGGWNRLIGDFQKITNNYHTQFPLRLGIPKEELRNRLKIPSQNFIRILQRLIREDILSEEGPLVRLPSHEIKLTDKQQAKVDTLMKSLSDDPFSPPSESLPEPELVSVLIDKKLVVKMSDNIIFAVSAYDEMVKRVVDHLNSNGKITIAEVRDMFGTSRKYALALMEHLDEIKVTRRTGDERVLR